MCPPIALTDQQVAAQQYLADCYAGDITITPAPGHTADAVRFSVTYDGDPVCRWIVSGDGRVVAAWDPDYVLDGYDRRRNR